MTKRKWHPSLVDTPVQLGIMPRESLAKPDCAGLAPGPEAVELVMATCVGVGAEPGRGMASPLIACTMVTQPAQHQILVVSDSVVHVEEASTAPQAADHHLVLVGGGQVRMCFRALELQRLSVGSQVDGGQWCTAPGFRVARGWALSPTFVYNQAMPVVCATQGEVINCYIHVAALSPRSAGASAGGRKYSSTAPSLLL